ncbi:MAG: hypothetical protein U9Q07_04335 [Planctomycetota bacterium]|nr:hypothetical protein [Planctomycetota bacterium]
MKIEAIDEKKVRHYLADERLPIDGTKGEIVARLAQSYGELARDDVQMALCDNCECRGPAALDECPFCGDGSPVTTKAVVQDEEPRNELEAACAVIRGSIQAASQSLYNAGKALIRIIDDRLWEQQIGDDGQPFYKGPYPCIEDMCGVKRTTAHKLVRVARAYDAKTFADHGLNSLHISLRLPEKQRPRFLERAKTLPKRGEKVRELANEMIAESATGPAEEVEPVKKKPPPRPPTTARVRLKLGMVTLPMHKRPGVRDEHLAPATSLKDHPWCDLHLGGDTFLGIRIAKSLEGEVVAIVEFREVQKSSGSGTLTVKA